MSKTDKTLGVELPRDRRKKDTRIRPLPAKKHDKKPFVIEARWTNFFGIDRGWRKWAAYRTFEVADKALKQLSRKYDWMQVRHKSD